MIDGTCGILKMLMNLQPSDVLFIAFVLWLAWEAINGGDGGGGGRRRGRVPTAA
jgi:hypothetical protein